jgi:hypothetical protein
VVDDFARECLSLVADTSHPSLRVVRELDAIVPVRGRRGSSGDDDWIPPAGHSTNDFDRGLTKIWCCAFASRLVASTSDPDRSLIENNAKSLSVPIIVTLQRRRTESSADLKMQFKNDIIQNSPFS